MRYSKEFLKMLILAAQGTADNELTCGECWERVDRFAEETLTGADADSAYSLVVAHLEKCPACAVEFNALLQALKATTRRSAIQS